MRLIFLGFLGLLMTACQDVQVQRVEAGPPPVVFSTYAWGQAALSDVPDASAQLVELDEELRAIVVAEMRARGYRLVDDTAQADMVIDYQVAVINEEFVNDDSNPSWDAQFDSNAQEGVVELPQRSGAPRVTLTLGIGREGEPAIWGGSAEKLIARPENAQERQRILGTAVQELLRNLPAAVY